MRLDNFIAYSQNFLTNKGLVKRLITISDISHNDIAYDIGAGSGLITEELALVAKKVVAVEIDPLYVKKLKLLQNHYKNVAIIEADFMDATLPDCNYKVFANIPFNFTSRILKRLYFSDTNSPCEAYFFIQKEAFYKYSGIKRMTQIALLLKPFYEIMLVEPISKTDFRPIPKVEIVFIKIAKKSAPSIDPSDIAEYRDFTVYLTSAFKPQIKYASKKLFTYNQLKRLAIELNFKLGQEILDLKYEIFLALFNFYKKNVIDNKKKIVNGSYDKKIIRDTGLEKRTRPSITR